MITTNDSIFLLAATLLGAVLQRIPVFFKQRGNQRVAALARPLVMGYWLTLGIVLISEGVPLLFSADKLLGISYMALGLGMTLSGLGQVLGRAWLRITGVVIIAVGPVTSGLQFIQAGSQLNGMITLALGLGVLVGALQGWIGGIGRVVVSTLLLGSGVMLLLEALVWSAAPPDPLVAAIGVGLLALSIWGLIGGGLAVFRAIRPPAEQEQAVT